MPRYRHNATNLDIGLGQPFEHNGYKYPANWLQLASSEEIVAIGLEAYEPPAPAPEPPPPRSALGTDLLDALTDVEAQQVATLKHRDLWHILSRGQDQILFTNSKLGRAAGKAGITVEDWFTRIGK